jgi:hypothetical protein
MTITAAATSWNFQGPAGGTQTFTTNGQIVGVAIVINTVSGTGTVVFADNVTSTDLRTLTLTTGILNINNQTVTIGRFSSSGTLARTLAFGSSGVINLIAGNGTVWSGATTTNFTVTGTAVVNATFAGVDALGRIFNTGSMTEANAISFNITGGVNNISLTGSYNNLNFTGYSGSLQDGSRTVFGNLTISETMSFAPATAGITTTLSGTGGTRTITTGSGIISLNFNLNGAGRTWQLQNNLTTAGGSATAFTLSQGTLDLNNLTLTTATFVTSAGTARSIAFGTSGVIDVTGDNATIWSASTVTGFSYTGTGRVNAVGTCVLTSDLSPPAGNMSISYFSNDSTETAISKLTNKFLQNFAGGGTGGSANTGDVWAASATVNNVEFAANFFSDEGVTAKSGADVATWASTSQLSTGNLDLAIVENYTS